MRAAMQSIAVAPSPDTNIGIIARLLHRSLSLAALIRPAGHLLPNKFGRRVK